MNMLNIIKDLKEQHKKLIIGLMKVIAVISLLIIFNDVIFSFVFSFVDEFIIPITNKIESNSYAVLISCILLVVLAYLINGFIIYKKKYFISDICVYALIAFVFYSFFRFNEHYDFYAVSNITYIDSIFVTYLVMEVLSYIFPRKRKLEYNEQIKGFMPDNPSDNDKLGRSDYAKLLFDKICSTYMSGSLKEGAMIILLNERYGAGKTTFLRLLEQEAKDKINTCYFKPWQASDGGQMTEELLSILEEKYDTSKHLVKLLEKYSELLSNGEVKNLLEFISHLFVSNNSQTWHYEEIKKALKEINDPLIVIVDDVDRLQSEELLALLKLLRNTADFPNVIYIVAADKNNLSLMLEMKGIKDADEYLKKFFNFELLFPKDDSFLPSLLREQIEGVLTEYCDIEKLNSSIEKYLFSTPYVQSVFHSPRDIYRFVNLLTYTLDLFKQYNVILEVNLLDFLKLTLIQFVSPNMYKVLRDEMDILLDVRGTDGRIHLKDAYKEIIISRQSKMEMKKIMSQVRPGQVNLQDDNNEHSENDDSKQSDKNLSLKDIPSIERYNKEDIVSEIISDLFLDTQNYQEKNRICYLGEYFKFFAGKYSKDELSAQYMKETMELSSDSLFEDRITQAVRQGKKEFLIHKLKQYIEDKNIRKDIPFVLKRCITIQDVMYHDWSNGHTSYYPKDYCKMNLFFPVYYNLLTESEENIITDESEIEKITSIYDENSHYTWLACSLLFPINEFYKVHYVYGDRLRSKLKARLIKRFIEEELTENPFEAEKIMAIPMMIGLNRKYWNHLFKGYINNYSDPMVWLYILFKPSGDSLEWNDLICDNLVENGDFVDYAKIFLGLEVTQDISQDLSQISYIHEHRSLTQTAIEQHPFLIKAKEWWDAKEKK